MPRNMSYRDDKLRPPLEFLPVAGCVILLAGLAGGWPGDTLRLGLVQPVAAVVGLLLAARLCQLLSLLRYRRCLGRSSICRVSRIPMSRSRLFLGMGFSWQRRHKQRLHEAREADMPSGSSGDAALHGVGAGRESRVWMDLSERNGHTLVMGTTRVGKTRLAEMLVAQDIMRGEGVMVLDPKGDIELLRRMASVAKEAGRSHHFRVFHLGFPESSSTYNPVGEFSHITEVATRLARQLPASGDSAAFREFAWRFTNIVAQAVVALGHKPDLELIARNITNMEGLFIEYGKHYLRERGMALPKGKDTAAKGRGGRHPLAVELANHFRASKVSDPVLLGLMNAFNYERNYFDKITASLLPLLEKMTSGATGRLLTPGKNAAADELRWREVIAEGQIVYVGLDALSDPDVASAIGNSMLADLTSVAGEIYKHGIRSEPGGKRSMPRVCLHVDEFNELAGEEFIPLLNKSGGAGIQVTAYTQTASDMEAAVGDLGPRGTDAGQHEHPDDAAGEEQAYCGTADQPAKESAGVLAGAGFKHGRFGQRGTAAGVFLPQRGQAVAIGSGLAGTGRPDGAAQGTGLCPAWGRRPLQAEAAAVAASDGHGRRRGGHSRANGALDVLLAVAADNPQRQGK